MRGWDPDQQQAVTATAEASTTSVDVANGELSPASVAKLFSADSKFVVGDRPLRNDNDVQHVADAVAEQIGSAFAEAEGIAVGDPLLRAGRPSASPASAIRSRGSTRSPPRAT